MGGAPTRLAVATRIPHEQPAAHPLEIMQQQNSEALLATMNLRGDFAAQTAIHGGRFVRRCDHVLHRGLD